MTKTNKVLLYLSSFFTLSLSPLISLILPYLHGTEPGIKQVQLTVMHSNISVNIIVVLVSATYKEGPVNTMNLLNFPLLYLFVDW